MAKQRITNKLPSVSVIVPMKNSATTLVPCLESIEKQKYPVREIIIVDNVSIDNSVQLALDYKKKSKITVHVLQNKVNVGVGASYNRGVKKSTSGLIVFVHSDSSIPTVYELEKLVSPLLESKKVVATFPTVYNPQAVWETYNFWQKCLFARAVGKDSPGFNGKFDCLRKDTFVKIGGYDAVHYGENIGIGSEDGDLYLRMEQEGEIVHSKARVIHLHYLGKQYKMTDWIKNRKLLAKSYGRILRLHWKSLPIMPYGIGLKIPLGALLFMVKPALSISPFIPVVQVVGIPALFAYLFLNSRKMYTTASTLRDPRILILPLLDFYLLYAEVIWMFQTLLFMKKKI